MKYLLYSIFRMVLPALLLLHPGCVQKEEGNKTLPGHEVVGPGELHLSDQQVQLGHIHTETLREQELGDELCLTGVLGPDKRKISVLSSGVMGRIEKLYVKNIGETVHKGQALYDIYSEEINLALRELALAKAKKSSQINSAVDIDNMIISTRNKLMLYGLSGTQIDELKEGESFFEIITIKSSIEGIITGIDISEGGYIMAGGSIFHITDYSSLWAEVQVFSEDIQKIREDMPAFVTISGNTEHKLKGLISFANPELNSSSKINLIRIEIPNEKNILKPGMQLQACILLDTGFRLAVPTDAIILEEEGSSVWLQTGPNHFKNVMVHTGIESNGYTEVIHGLKKGDLVVITGNYLLHSELTFKTGNSEMSGHQH